MCNRNHGLTALGETLSRDVGNAVLRCDRLNQRARRGDRAAARNKGENVRFPHAVLREAGGIEADIAATAFRAERALQKVHLAAYARELHAVCGFCVFLSHEVHLHAAVNADDAAKLRDAERIVNVVDGIRAEELRILPEPVIEGSAAHCQVKAAEAGVEFLAGIRELTCEVELPIGVADGAGVAAEIFFIGVRESGGNCEGNRADTEREHGTVRNFVYHEFRNSLVNLRRRTVIALGQRRVRALDNHIRFIEAAEVGAVDTRQKGKVLVDFKDDRLCARNDGLPEVATRAETHIALGIRAGNRDKGNVRAEFSLPIEEGNQAKCGRHKFDSACAVEFALVVAEVCALIAEGLSLRICLENRNLGGNDETAAHGHIANRAAARRKCRVQKFGKASAEAVVNIITVPYGQNRLRRRDIVCFSAHGCISFFYCQNSGKYMESQSERSAKRRNGLTKVNK